MAGAWHAIGRGAEGIEVLPDGKIKLSALRASGQTYVPSFDPANPGHLLAINPKKIRITAAVPLDNTVRSAYKLSTDPSSLPTGNAIADGSIEPGRIRQHYTQCGQTYKKWLRKGSFPTPESLRFPDGTTVTQATDLLGTDGLATNALRDDTEYLNNQAQKRLSDKGRVPGERPIILKGLVFSYKPGDAIKDVEGVDVSKIVKEVIHYCGQGCQKTELVLA